MEPNKILSAPLLDLLFDNRNKSYGAYYLRITDASRTAMSLLVTISVTALALALTSFKTVNKKNPSTYQIGPEIKIQKIKEPVPEKETPVTKKKETTPTRTIASVVPKIIEDELVTKPMAAVADLDSAIIDTKTREGDPYIFSEPPPGDDKGGSGEAQPIKPAPEEEEIKRTVDVQAKFSGNWIGFLERNLNAEVPVDNNAPAGRYSVVIQFVVDKEGSVSDIKALTAHGYGLEEEAVRVLRKAPKWQPALQNGVKVKAYHKQVIVFEVVE